MVDEVDLKEFLKEFWTLHNVGHHVNIINLIGATVDVSECMYCVYCVYCM